MSVRNDIDNAMSLQDTIVLGKASKETMGVQGAGEAEGEDAGVGIADD